MLCLLLRNTLYNRPYVASYTISSLPPYRSEESKKPPSTATDLVRLASAAHISPRCSLEAGDILRRPARSHAQAAQWTPPQQQSFRGESIRPRMPFMVLSRDEYHVPSVTRIYRVCLFHFPPQRWLSYCHVGDSGVRRASQAYVHRVPPLGSAFFPTSCTIAALTSSSAATFLRFPPVKDPTRLCGAACKPLPLRVSAGVRPEERKRNYTWLAAAE